MGFDFSQFNAQPSNFNLKIITANVMNLLAFPVAPHQISSFIQPPGFLNGAKLDV